MKILKKIIFVLLCGVLSIPHTYAVIVETWALKNPYHVNKDNVVLGLSDLHNFPHSATKNQLEAIKSLIKSYKPEDVCVVVEAFEFLEEYPLRERAEQAELQDCKVNMLNQIAAYCVQNGVEVHSIDFRKVWVDASKQESISISREPERVPNLVAIIKKQIARIDAVNPTILNKANRMIFRETFNKGKIPPEEMLKFFIKNLIDARIVAHVCTAKKKITIVIAGTAHTIAVRKQLEQQSRYELITQDAAVDMKICNQLARIVNKQHDLADKLINGLNIQKFAEKIRETIGSTTEPAESKDDQEAISTSAFEKSKKQKIKTHIRRS